MRRFFKTVRHNRIRTRAIIKVGERERERDVLCDVCDGGGRERIVMNFVFLS